MEPNSEDLRVAGITLKNLYDSLGRTPNNAEMVNALVRVNYFSSDKAKKIIDMLGM